MADVLERIGNKYPDALEILCWLGILKGALSTASGSHCVTEDCYNHYTTLSYIFQIRCKKLGFISMHLLHDGQM